VKQRYLEVGRKMKEYEDGKYEHWKETTEQSLPTLMKKSLLTKVRPSTLPTKQGRPPSS
jgi:dynein heavy chain